MIRKKILSMGMCAVITITGTFWGDVIAKSQEKKGEEECYSGVWVCPTNESILEDVEELPVYQPKKKVSIKAVTKNSMCGRYGYNQLELEEQKWAYERLEEAANAFQMSADDATEITYQSTGKKGYIAVTVPMDEKISLDYIGKAVVCFLYDHPEYVWSLGYSYYVNRDNMMVTKVSLACHEDYADGTERLDLLQKMQKEIEQYLDLIKGIGTDYEKELILHDAIAEKITYAYSADSKAESERWAHTIEGVFSDEYYSAVCEGYAKAFQLLLNAAGIENVYVVGTANGTGHAWTQVKIEGDWYNVDLTWNDTGDSKSYRYFNVPDYKFTGSHKAFTTEATENVGKWCYDLNACTSTEYSYTTKGSIRTEDTFYVGFRNIEGAEGKVYNNGVEVVTADTVTGEFPSYGSCKVVSGTALSIEISPFKREKMLEVIVVYGEKEKKWTGIVGNQEIQIEIPSVTMDTWIDVLVKEVTADIETPVIIKTPIIIEAPASTEVPAITEMPANTETPVNTERPMSWDTIQSLETPKTPVPSAPTQTVETTLEPVGQTTAGEQPTNALNTEQLSISSDNSAIAGERNGTSYISDGASQISENSKKKYIKITTKKTKVKVGKTISFKGVLYGTAGKIVWSSSNKKKATIGKKNGKLKAKSVGSVYVIAKKGKLVAKKKIKIVKK